MTFTSMHIAGAILVMAVAAPVAAEQLPVRQPAPFSTRALDRIVRDASAGPAGIRLSRAAAQRGRRDSILNGGLIGAAVGGVAGSFLIVAASGGSDDVPRAMFRIASFTAPVGFLIGAMIDAEF